MIKRILINGCSHSAGSEIEGPGIGEGNYNRQYCFGAQLADKLGVENINLSWPGGANDYISRTTMFWCLNHPELVKDTLFLIHWTGPDRMEYYSGKSIDTDHRWIPEIYDDAAGHIMPCHSWPGFPPGEKRAINNFSKSIFLYPCHWEVNRYLNIIQTQTLLKSLGARYIFRNAFSNAQDHERFRVYFEKIDQSNFKGLFDKDESFFDHCLNRGHSVEEQYFWHHQRPAHDYWAEKLYREEFT